MTRPKKRPSKAKLDAALEVAVDDARRARQWSSALTLSYGFLADEGEDAPSRETTENVGIYLIPLLVLLDFPPAHLATVRTLLEAMARKGRAHG